MPCPRTCAALLAAVVASCGGGTLAARAAPPVEAVEEGEAGEVPCTEPQPASSVCRCLRVHVETWGEDVKATCALERRLGEAWLARVSTTDTHAGTQYFVVHDGRRGSSVIGQLAHHTPGSGGVYRYFAIDGAAVAKLGPGRILRVDTTVVEKEIPIGGAGTVRELSRYRSATLCVLAAPGRSRPVCLAGLPTLDRGSEGAPGQTWERIHELHLGVDGTVAHVPIRGLGADEATRRKLW